MKMNDQDEVCMITATVRVLLQADFGNVSAMKVIKGGSNERLLRLNL